MSLSPPPVPVDEEIARYGVLDGPPGRELQALVELASLVCAVPKAAINIITTTEQHQVATVGVDASVCARADSMCAAVLEVTEAVVVPDATLDATFRHNPFVTGDRASVRFYASAPLITDHGVPLGRLCVFDDEPRELDAEQARALEVVAARVVDVLELRLRSQELERSLHELTRTQSELHRSNERLATFAGQVSHDLRTPLTAMMLNTELAAGDAAVVADPQLGALLHTALGAGRRMAKLIDDVLDYALVGGELSGDLVELDDLVEEVLADLQPAILASGAEIRVADRLGTVTGERQQLYSVFLNLFTNALKFCTPGDSPRVRVCAAPVDAGLLRIEVTDQGIGIRPEDQGSLFDLFTRGDRSVPGSGIGLATVRAAVAAHGGAVGVRSEPGHGTTFWFTLPCPGED